MGEPLPVPPQLEAQLDKCKTVRSAAEYYKPRTKTAEASAVRCYESDGDRDFRIDD